MNTLAAKMADALFAKRHIPQELASAMGVVSRGMNLGFEFRERGHVKFVKWRTHEKRFWIEPSGEKLCLWNLDTLRDHTQEMVIITEGEIDALSWMAAGAPHVVSVPNGAPGKPGQGDVVPAEDDAFAYLWNGDQLIPELIGVKKIILSTDGDKPGRVLAEELAIRLGRDRCWLVSYPEGMKDASDVLMALGCDGVVDLLTTAKPLSPSELTPLTDIARNPFSVGHTTGWTQMNKILQICPPELMIVTGFPNAGKSQFVWGLCANLSRIHGWRGAIIQFEDGVNRVQDAFMTYAETWSRDPKQNEVIQDPHAWVRRNVLMPRPENDDDLTTSPRNMQWVLDRIKEAGQRHGCRWVIVDPWNEIEHDWGRQFSETQYISRMLKLLKQAARKYSLLLIVVVHPTKEAASKSIDDATPYDINGGAAWYNKADHCLIIKRHPHDKSVVHVKNAKSRNEAEMGVQGICRMRFDKDRSIYTYDGDGSS